jgi:hypothetical protein
MRPTRDKDFKMAKTKTDIAILIGQFIVGTSAGFTVNAVLKNNIDPEKRRHKVEAWIGSIVLGAVAAEHAEAWIARQIRAVSDGVEIGKEQAKEDTTK